MTEYMNVIIHSIKEWVSNLLGSYVQKDDVDGKLVPSLSADGSDAGSTLVASSDGEWELERPEGADEALDLLISSGVLTPVSNGTDLFTSDSGEIFIL